MSGTFARIQIGYGHFLFRYRNALFPAVFLVLLVVFPPVPFLHDARLDIWLDIGGILVILSGQALRAAVIGLAYIKRGGVNKKIYADGLVTSGIFAHCRNPLYAGNLAILCGFLVIHNNPWVYILGGGFFVFSYQAIIKAEEVYLQQKFGDEFGRYCQKVKRWTINLSGIKNTLHSMEFNWRRVILKDYSTILTWSLTTVLIITREYMAWHDVETGRAFLLYTSLPLAATALLSALAVRTLKKAGRLTG